jgi:DNA-directed RNA polymerase subunit RPC12/RpoP
MRGNTWIELVLYLCYIVPGIIYSIWRRQGPLNVCQECHKESLVPAAAAKHAHVSSKELRDEVEYPHCAEKILARANICKHCGKQVRVAPIPNAQRV